MQHVIRSQYGHLLNTLSMMINTSRFIAVLMKVSGTNAQIVIRIQVIIQYLPVLPVTQTQKQTTNTMGSVDIYIKMQHVWLAIQPAMQTEHLIMPILAFHLQVHTRQ